MLFKCAIDRAQAIKPDVQYCLSIACRIFIIVSIVCIRLASANEKSFIVVTNWHAIYLFVTFIHCRSLYAEKFTANEKHPRRNKQSSDEKSEVEEENIHTHCRYRPHFQGISIIYIFRIRRILSIRTGTSVQKMKILLLSVWLRVCAAPVPHLIRARLSRIRNHLLRRYAFSASLMVIAGNTMAVTAAATTSVHHRYNGRHTHTVLVYTHACWYLFLFLWEHSRSSGNRDLTLWFIWICCCCFLFLASVPFLRIRFYLVLAMMRDGGQKHIPLIKNRRRLAAIGLPAQKFKISMSEACAHCYFRVNSIDK